MTKKGTGLSVHLCLPELIKVSKELEHVCATASGETKWWPVILEVLAKGVPVSPLLGLVPAQCRWWYNER